VGPAQVVQQSSRGGSPSWLVTPRVTNVARVSGRLCCPEEDDSTFFPLQATVLNTRSELLLSCKTSCVDHNRCLQLCRPQLIRHTCLVQYSNLCLLLVLLQTYFTCPSLPGAPLDMTTGMHFWQKSLPVRALLAD